MSKFFILIFIGLSNVTLGQNTSGQINSQKTEKKTSISLKENDTTYTHLSLQTASNQSFIMIGIPEEELRQVYKDGYISSGQVFVQVENMPEFPGGQTAFYEYLGKNIQPKGIYGNVYVYFVINRSGKVQDAKVVRGVQNGSALNDEALRVINAMPNWKAGTQNGRPVNVQFTLPIKFVLTDVKKLR